MMMMMVNSTTTTEQSTSSRSYFDYARGSGPGGGGNGGGGGGSGNNSSMMMMDTNSNDDSNQSFNSSSMPPNTGNNLLGGSSTSFSFHNHLKHSSISQNSNTSGSGEQGSGGKEEKSGNNAFSFGKCKICSDKATGIHYGVASCEACKGFYKRSTLKKELYTCLASNNCKITVKNRGNCKACRLRRCIQAGMSLNGIKMGRIPIVVKQKLIDSLKEAEQNPQSEPPKNTIIGNFIRDEKNNIIYIQQNTFVSNDLSGTAAAAVTAGSTSGDGSGGIILKQNFSLEDLAAIHEPFKTSNLIPNTTLCRLFGDTIHNDKIIMLSSLLCDKVNQMFMAFCQEVFWMEKRAKQLIEAGIRDFPGADKPIQHVRDMLIQSTVKSYYFTYDFACELPGLTQICQEDLSTFIESRRYEMGFVKLSSLLINGESYYYLEDDLQYTTKWMKRIMGEQMAENMISFTKQFNSLELTTREKALMCALLLTAPSNTLQNPGDFSQLNEFYMRAILYEFDLNRRDHSFMDKLSKILVKLTGMGRTISDARVTYYQRDASNVSK